MADIMYPAPILLEKHDGEFIPTTYNESRAAALNIGAGLAALGIERGDRVSILAEGCNNWIISELGLLYAGAISVPLSIKLEESNDLLFRLRHADVKAIFVSRNQLPKIRRISRPITPAPITPKRLGTSWNSNAPVESTIMS